MKIIGITGNIASGKSTISKIIAEHLKVPLISVDEFSKNWIMLFKYKIDAAFECYRMKIDPSVDTLTNFRNVLFTEQASKRDDRFRDSISFKGYVEKMISKDFWDYLHHDLLTDFYDIVVVEHPLMFEMSETHKFDYVIGVHCDIRIRLERMMKRGYNSPSTKERMDAQIPFKQNARYCDLVINTTNNPDKEYAIQQLQNSKRFEALVSQGAVT
jgi:dephospho-CoA kinase